MPDDRITIVVWEFLEELGMNNMAEDSRSVAFSCPFDGHRSGDSTPSNSMSKDYPYPWHCFTCGRGGNAVHFLSELEGVPPFRAKRYMRERFKRFVAPEGTVTDEVEAFLSRAKHRPTVFLDEQEATGRSIDWHKAARECEGRGPLTYMLNRGFEPVTLERYDVGFDFVSAHWISIPYRDVEGRLLGFKARTWGDEKPKYMMLGGDGYPFDTFDTSRHVFGLNMVRRESYGKDLFPLVVCEGELNSMMLWQHGVPRSVAISGQFLTEQQVSLIAGHCEEATLVFDEPEKAIRAGRMLETRLNKVLIVPEHEHDPAELTEDENVELLRSAVSIRSMI